MEHPSAKAVGRLLVEEAFRDSVSGADVQIVANVLLGRLRTHLGAWIGADAVDSLVERALIEIQSRRRMAAVLEWHPAELTLSGLESAGASAAERKEITEELVCGVTELLGRFVGLDISTRLIRDAWFISQRTDGDPSKANR